MTPAEEHRFQELVQRYFAAHGQEAAFAPNGALSLNGKLSAALCLDLEGLAAKCLIAKPRDWESVVRAHFDAHLGLAPPHAAADPFDDIASAQHLLVAAPVRLDEGRQDSAQGRGIVYRRDLEGLPTVLFLRHANGLRPVEKSRFEKWGTRPSELFRIALKNVRRELRIKSEPFDLGNGRRAVVLRADSELTAACVYFLGALPGAAGRLGSVFTIPHARRVIVCPVDSSEDLDALSSVLLVAARRQVDGCAVSEAAYHWDGRHFRVSRNSCPESPQRSPAHRSPDPGRC